MTNWENMIKLTLCDECPFPEIICDYRPAIFCPWSDWFLDIVKQEVERFATDMKGAADPYNIEELLAERGIE